MASSLGPVAELEDWICVSDHALVIAKQKEEEGLIESDKNCK